ncbi:hypothetical protein C6I20_02250 [Aeromicrobium sp. A1-2]|uniref:fibronectin type III domain-containing protein n=1 Tax=Aeromicrobium sp. A1-2 TaxID=2107713 RepID=UPI000E4BE76C|nr:fibronectin type III domain-containing protein [Aeromicrobium sp. A1-2]AXT84130.1 hypothetical protein C6I20_02250 [Aeromicrobium sp. A1-2]
MNITRFVTRGVIPLSALALLSTALVLGVQSPSVAPVETRGTPAVVRDHSVPVTVAADRVHVAPQAHDHDEEADSGVTGPDVDTVVAELPETVVEPFSMLGVTWKSGLVLADTVVQARWRADGTWTAWSDLDIEPYEEGTPGTEPVWVGRADAAAIRVLSSADAEPAGVALSTIDPGKSPTLTPTAETVATTSGVSQPTVITRSQWGAKEGSSCDSPIYGSSTKGVVVHHTAGSNSYSKSQSASIVKSTQAYHTNSRNWCDIGYNFLVDKYGQVFEGRKGGVTKSVRAAHSGNGTVNEQTAGISLMGTFETTAPSNEMKAALVKLAAWKLALHGDPAKGTYSIGGVTLNRIAGHRNVVSTACPGAKVYAWLTSTSSTGLRSQVEKAMEEGGSAEPLPTPTGLTATGQTLSSVSLDWSDVEGAEKYHVKASTSSSMSSPTYGKFTESKGTVTGLTPGKKYYFSVVVVDPERNVRLSEYSGAPYPTAETPAATTPTGLKATSATSTSLSFDWDDVVGAEKYHVKVSTSSTLSPPTFGKFTESKGTVTGLTPGKKYYFAVVVVDPERNVRLSDYTSSPYPSEVLPLKDPAAGKMSTPTGLEATSATSTSLSFDWDDVVGAEKYHVKVSTSSTLSSPTFGKFTESKGTVTGLTPGKKYYFAVVVVDPERNVRLSDYTSSPYPSAVTPTGKLPTPTGLKATAATSTSLSFDWDDVVGAEKYHVKVSTSSTLSPPTFGKFTESKGTVTGLTPGKKYYFAVVVVDPERNVRLSDYTSSPYPSAVTPTGKMSTPTGLEATAATSTSLSFDWDDVVGAEKYHVKVSTSSTLSPRRSGSSLRARGP